MYTRKNLQQVKEQREKREREEAGRQGITLADIPPDAPIPDCGIAFWDAGRGAFVTPEQWYRTHPAERA